MPSKPGLPSTSTTRTLWPLTLVTNAWHRQVGVPTWPPTPPQSARRRSGGACQGAVHRPIRPTAPSGNRCRHLPTVCGHTPTSAATSVLDLPAAQPNTMRHRCASALRGLRPPRPSLQRLALLIGQHQLRCRLATTRHEPSLQLFNEFPAHDTRSASQNIRRPDDEYGEIEYGGLPVEYAVFVIMLCPREFQCPISIWLAGRSESVLIRNRCLFLNGVGIGAKSPTPAAGRLRAPETTHLSATREPAGTRRRHAIRGFGRPAPGERLGRARVAMVSDGT